MRKWYDKRMNVKAVILEILEDNAGKKVSGAELARRADASRNAVWKAINALAAEGYEIERSHTGYVLREDLSERGIVKYLTVPAGEIRVFDVVGSTNSEMKAAAAAGMPDRSIIAADRQTEGRGRYGRAFYSEKGTGVYFSILIRNIDFYRGKFLTAAAAVAVAESLEKLYGVSAQIKWVNDVYIGGKKCVGILTEAVTDLESGVIGYAVVGIGVNLKEPEGGFPKELQGVAGIPSDELPADAYNRAVAYTFNRFIELYDAFDRDALVKSYRSRSFLQGRTVGVMFDGKEAYTAVVKDVDENLNLVVVADDGTERTLNYGEVTLKI